MATTRTYPKQGEDGSHLCPHTNCKTVGHVIWEEKNLNQQRKGCAVWIPCPHAGENCKGCKGRILVCPHGKQDDHLCIKEIEGVNYEDYKLNPRAYFC